MLTVRQTQNVVKTKSSKLSRAVPDAEMEKLRRLETLYKATERAAEIGHYEWNYERDRLESCSEEYARIFDMTVEEVMEAHNCWEKVVAQVHPEDRVKFQKSNDEMRAHHHFDMEYRVILDNGDTRHLREICVSVVDEEAIIKGNFGIVQDITRQVKHASELQQRDELARQAELLTDIGHYIYDEENEVYIYMSEGFARIHGTTVKVQMNSMQSLEDDLDRVIEADRQRVEDEYKHYIETGEDLAIEYRILRGDGEERWLRELNQAKSMRNGRALHTLRVLQDITQQKEIEMELRYKDTLANQAEAITEIGHFLYDELAEKYLFVSNGMASIYGVDTDHLLNSLQSEQDDMEFVHVEDREALSDLYRESDATGEDWVAEFRMVRPDGEIRWIREIGKTHVQNNGFAEQTIGVLMDITESKNAEQEIINAKETLEQEVVERTSEHANTVNQLEEEIKERKRISAELQVLANHDALTGLPSLRLGKDRVQQALALSRRARQICAVMFLDLDGFKQINDEYGHEAGDQVLRVTADRIKAEIRETDTAARMGGDEFMIVLSCIPEISIVERIASNLIKQVAQSIDIKNAEARIGVSIGIALYPENGADVDELIRAADKAMYQVKSKGKNDFGFVGFKTGRKVISDLIVDADKPD